MKNIIFYYTGTGNSLWAAKKIAEGLPGTEIIPMKSIAENTLPHETDITGMVFPVYIWGVPSPVLDFIRKIRNLKTGYFFAVATNGGQVSNALVQLKKELASEGISLSSGFGLTMPSNYIPFGGPGSRETLDAIFRKAEEKIKLVTESVKGKELRSPEKGPLWHRLLFSMFYRMSFSHVNVMDKKFSADSRCTGCGICVKVCPAANISTDNGKPVWLHKCEQCFACLQWCPEKAIQYGEKTAGVDRYHHPEIKVSDIILSGKSRL